LTMGVSFFFILFILLEYRIIIVSIFLITRSGLLLPLLRPSCRHSPSESQPFPSRKDRPSDHPASFFAWIDREARRRGW
jgi:hypothetical protein